MTFNFDETTNRLNTNAVKWDVQDNELPMWVADMDFRTAPAITEAIQAKVASGIYGYQLTPDSYFQAVQGWWQTRHHWTPETEWMLFTTGVVPALSSAIRHLTQPGDQILLQAPVYNAFFHAIINNGRQVISSDLIYQNGTYAINYLDLEEKLADPLTTMMILCNPHNPLGRVWTKAELNRIGALAAKHNVMIASDEIHGDLTAPETSYVPFASASPLNAANSLTFVSTSKTFNMAAIHAATVIVPDPRLRAVMTRALSNDGLSQPNIVAIEGSIAAYTQGGDWVDALQRYVATNKQLVATFIKHDLPMLTVVGGEATYLLWIDCSRVSHDTTELTHFIRQETGLFISAGDVYGGNGHDFVRINLATTKARVQDGLNRLKRGIIAYQQRHKNSSPSVPKS